MLIEFSAMEALSVKLLVLGPSNLPIPSVKSLANTSCGYVHAADTAERAYKSSSPSARSLD
jgi:hypothetical protein